MKQETERERQGKTKIQTDKQEQGKKDENKSKRVEVRISERGD